MVFKVMEVPKGNLSSIVGLLQLMSLIEDIKIICLGKQNTEIYAKSCSSCIWFPPYVKSMTFKLNELGMCSTERDVLVLILRHVFLR